MDSESANDTELVDQHVRALGEHFDSVQIFVTKRIESGTRGLGRGSGDYWARFGRVKTWVLTEEESARLEAHHNDDE